jgi:2'-5' RNA ligase
MSNIIRRQLTLFVENKDAKNIELVRNKFNPQQSKLIKSHVTLCREDEIENLEKVIQNLVSIQAACIKISFAKAIRFENEKGVLLPATGDNKAFQQLRKLVLQGLNTNPRIQQPHITLMHPRNSTCSDDDFLQIAAIILPSSLVFKKISLIAQGEDGKWITEQAFDLKKIPGG